MLAPNVFVALQVDIEPALATGIQAQVFERERQLQARAAAVQRGAVHLVETAIGELCVLRIHQTARGEEHRLAVGRESHRMIIGRMVGEPFRRAASGRHHENIEIAMTVGSKSDLAAVGRPYRLVIVVLAHRQRPGDAALSTDHINITFVAKRNLAPIGRNRRVAHPQRGLALAVFFDKAQAQAK